MRTIISRNKVFVAGAALVFGGAVLFGGASVALARVNRPPVVAIVTVPEWLVVGDTGTWSVQAQDRNLDKLWFSVDWADSSISETVPSYRRKASFTHAY
jgi:hypothetical protein